MAEMYQKFIAKADKALHQPGKLKDIADKVESLTGVKRIYIFQGVLGLFVLYMVFGYFAQFVCNALGFAYPAYASIVAVESSSKEDDTKWLTYWIVFAAFSLLDFFSSFILSWVPFYWLAKVIFLVWCFLPSHMIENNGTDFIYTRVIRPYFQRHTSSVDAITSQVRDKIQDIAKQAKNN